MERAVFVSETKALGIADTLHYTIEELETIQINRLVERGQMKGYILRKKVDGVWSYVSEDDVQLAMGH